MLLSRITYTGDTPGADTNTYVLYDSSTNGVQALAALAGIKELTVDIKHDSAGTLNSYKSKDRGVTWEQIDSRAIAAPAATDTTYEDFPQEPYLDFKLEWVNGGAAQSPWDVDMALHDERAPTT